MTCVPLKFEKVLQYPLWNFFCSVYHFRQLAVQF